MEKLNFAGRKLVDTDFSNQDLSYVNFSDCNLLGVNFTNCILRYANFSYAYISRANFSYAELDGCDFANAKINSIKINEDSEYDENLEKIEVTEYIITVTRTKRFTFECRTEDEAIALFEKSPEYSNTIDTTGGWEFDWEVED